THPRSRAAFASLVAQGWCDAIRTLHPDDPMFTFWDYKRNRWPRDAGLRLRHLLLGPQVAPRQPAPGRGGGCDKKESLVFVVPQTGPRAPPPPWGGGGGRPGAAGAGAGP